MGNTESDNNLLLTEGFLGAFIVRACAMSLPEGRWLAVFSQFSERGALCTGNPPPRPARKSRKDTAQIHFWAALPPGTGAGGSLRPPSVPRGDILEAALKGLQGQPNMRVRGEIGGQIWMGPDLDGSTGDCPGFITNTPPRPQMSMYHHPLVKWGSRLLRLDRILDDHAHQSKRTYQWLAMVETRVTVGESKGP